MLSQGKVSAWGRERNTAASIDDWHFTSEDARIKHRANSFSLRPSANLLPFAVGDQVFEDSDEACPRARSVAATATTTQATQLPSRTVTWPRYTPRQSPVSI